jgi:hypothetical protein
MTDARAPRRDQPPDVRALTRSSANLLDALSGLDARRLAQRPAPDEWSAWDIAYHVAQIEVWYFAKLCEAASHDAPAAMARFLTAWQAIRAQGLALVAALPRERLDEAGLLSGVPDWTPRQLLERMAAHDQEHAAQARAAAEGDAKDRCIDGGARPVP